MPVRDATSRTIDAASLVRLRRERHLTPSDLADRAGLSARTVTDIEAGRRRRVQRRTLQALADSLGVSSGALTPRPPETAVAARRGRVRAALLWAGVGLALLGAGGIAWRHLAIRGLDYDVGENQLTFISAIAGTRAVIRHDARIGPPLRPGWHGGRDIVYGLGHDGADGGRVVCRDLWSGDERWSFAPDLDAVETVYGADIARDGAFAGARTSLADLDGDGVRELVAVFEHDRWYPAIISIVGANGEHRGSYHSLGRISDVLVTDLDGDGRDEILLGGTNNAHRGATIVLLDGAHCHGASVDAHANPDCAIGEGALARVVLPDPSSEYMERFAVARGHASDLSAGRFGEETTVTAAIHFGEPAFVVTFDASLTPRTCTFSDAMLGAVASWPPLDRDRFLSKEHRAAWLARFRTYGALHARADHAAVVPAR